MDFAMLKQGNNVFDNPLDGSACAQCASRTAVSGMAVS
jgi:hypothetical protein